MSKVVWGFPNEQAILVNEAQSSVELLGYKSYVFSVSQIPGDPPVFYTIHSTFDNPPIWQVSGPGQYSLAIGETMNGARAVTSANGGSFYGASIGATVIFNYATNATYYIYLYPVVASVVNQNNWTSNGFNMEVFDSTGNLVELDVALDAVAPGPGDLVNNITFEVRYYI